MYKLIIGIALYLVAIYYLLVFCHLIGAIKLTKEDVDAKRLLIPFYYFFNHQNKK
jgi:hypothetical protein